MKILFACIPVPGNRFMIDLKDGLESFATVTWNFEEFWSMENMYDIIHIHWPEYLSFELENYLYNKEKFTEDLWNRLIDCLNYWSEHSTIIYTRHVQYPHARHDNEFLKLYRLCASYCRLVVHFANFSVKQFQRFYPDLNNVKHVVIPHQNYYSLPNTISKVKARELLGIHPGKKVMLVFGTINEKEKKIIKLAFKYIPGNKKVLLAPGWKIYRRKIGYIRLREWIYKLELWISGLNPRRIINKGFVKEEDAQIFLNAADFLFIPRTDELNSGNITLGCTFGLIVVGKDHADIGEILKETGNPVFTINNSDSIKKAIQSVYKLLQNNHGEINRRIALEEWKVQKISKMYISEMVQLLT